MTPQEKELHEMLGLDPEENHGRRTYRSQQQMCECGLLPAPCGCVTFDLGAGLGFPKARE